jgi:hypothetical protein
MKSYKPSEEFLRKNAKKNGLEEVRSLAIGSLGDESGQVLNVKEQKKPKVVKDPEAPKKPLPAYIIFSKQERMKIVSDLGNLSMGEVAKELGKRWNGLDAESKAEFEAASNEDKERYKEEMKSYKPSEEFLRKKAEKKNSLAPVLVAAPGPGEESLGGYSVEAYFAFLFSNWSRVRDSHPTESPKLIQEQIWEQWRSTGGSLERGTLAVTKKEKKVKKVRDPLAPKRPVTAYILFANSKRAEVMRSQPELSYKLVMAELGRMWSELEEEHRAPFLARQQELRAEYATAVEERRNSRDPDQQQSVGEMAGDGPTGE